MEDVLPSMLRLILHGDNRSNIHLLIALIGGILCFTPMYGNVVSNIETLDSVDVIHNGILFKCASAVSVMLAVLLFLDLLFDFMASMMARTKQQGENDVKEDDNHVVDVLNGKEMLLFLAGIIILPMTSFLPFGAVKNFVLFVQMCSRAQMMFISGTVLASLNRFDSKYFPTLITLGILVVFIVGQTIFPYYINAVNYVFDAKLLLIVTICSWVLGVVFFLLCAYYIFDTVLFTLCGFKRWKLPFYEYCCSRVAPVAEVGENNGSIRPDAEKQPYTNGQIFFRLTYCTMIIVFILIRAVLLVKYPTLAFLNDVTLFMMLVPYILLASCILVFNLRLVKHEAVESLIALLDAKKSYVRYISHGTYSLGSNIRHSILIHESM